MFDARFADRSTDDRTEHAPPPAPGRSTRVQEAEAAEAEHEDDGGASEPLFAAGGAWEDISAEEGEEMQRGLAASPAALEQEEDEEEEGGATAAKASAREEDDEEEDTSSDGDDDGDLDGSAGGGRGGARAARKQRKVPSSAYATAHGKEMRNYSFIPGTRVENTVSTANGVTSPKKGDFGAPNEYAPGKVKRRYRKELLRTVSVDIGTVVGGKRPKFLDGWVLVFHKTFVKKGKKRIKVNSGDHTGWIRVGQLAPSAIRVLGPYQDQVRRGLARGKGAGHKAKVKGAARTFSINNAEVITRKKDPASFFEFRIDGGSGSTPLGNYTHRPASYGDVIVGVWNPPGSGSGGERFGGSGGVRAFLPLTAKLKLADVGAMEVADTTGRGTSTWRYVRTKLNGEKIYCWVLQSWRTPKGSGSNF